nr:hypothetical protein [Tanacetum cinerariifolium]
MIAIGASVSDYTSNLAIISYHYLGHIEQGFAVLGYCFKRGIVPQITTYNSFLESFLVKEKTHEAERLFKMFVKNQISCKPDIITYHKILRELCRIGNNFTAVGLLRLMDARPGTCKPQLGTYGSLINIFCKDKMVADASMLFKEIVSYKNITTDVYTYNTFIYAFSKLGRWGEVTRMLIQMKDQNICLCMNTCYLIVDALCKQGKVKEATDAIDIMVDHCKYPDIRIYNSLIDGYSLLGDMTEARNIFDLLNHRGAMPNVDTFNKLLFGYYNNFMVDEARYFHDYMVDDTTYFHDYVDSFALFQFMDDNKLNSHIDVYNILIDRASKCLKFDTAKRLFHDLIVQSNCSTPKTQNFIFSRIGFAIQKGVAAQLVARLPAILL